MKGEARHAQNSGRDHDARRHQGARLALPGDQFAKFIEQGSQSRCTPAGNRYICFVSNDDLALAALTNGAARLAADATLQYQQAENEAQRNRRDIFR